MCIVFLSFHDNLGPNGYRLVIAANRDEFYNRPTAPAHFWENNPDVLGGMDLFHGKEGGTWLAMTKTGKLGFLTNYRQSKDIRTSTEKQGRGNLVSDFLTSDVNTEEYIKKIQQDNGNYNGFSLIVGKLGMSSESKLAWFCNVEDTEVKMLQPGNYIQTNRTLDFPWPKVVYGRRKFEEILESSQNKKEFLDGLFGLLNMRQRHFPDEDNSNYKTLEDEKVPEKFKDACRSIFVTFEGIYGTRTNTVILVDGAGHVTYVERTMDISDDVVDLDKEWITSSYEFDLLESTTAKQS